MSSWASEFPALLSLGVKQEASHPTPSSGVSATEANVQKAQGWVPGIPHMCAATDIMTSVTMKSAL